jgi:DNA-binding response OmpR family regulator
MVLLIEDNPAVIAAVADCLHGAGYQLLCAADVEDAVRKVASRAVSLVLLNWRLLARIGGSDLIAQLRNSSRARLPMVAISDEVSALNEASSLGIEDYLLDPFNLDDLLHVVDEHCC